MLSPVSLRVQTRICSHNKDEVLVFHLEYLSSFWLFSDYQSRSIYVSYCQLSGLGLFESGHGFYNVCNGLCGFCCCCCCCFLACCVEEDLTEYSTSLLRLYSPSPSLRSASETQIFRVRRVCRGTLGERSFQYIGPVIWNSLSFSVRHATTLSSFKSKLKTHLFSSAY